VGIFNPFSKGEKMKLLIGLLLLATLAKAEIIVPPAPAPTPTTAQLQKQLKMQMTGQLNQLYSQIIKVSVSNFNAIWSNPKLTPQQCFDAFGTNAANLLQVYATMQTAMNAIVPDSLPQAAPNALTVNSDGTVTVGAPLVSKLKKK
jgi:hypothetical protein